MKSIQIAATALAMATLVASQPADAACPVFPDRHSSSNSAGTSVAAVSGLAVAGYYLRAFVGGGNAPIFNPSAAGVPGWTDSVGNKGFTGSGTTIHASYTVAATAVVGQYRDIDVQILALNGATVCRDTFRVYVSHPPGWTAWLNRDGPSGSGDFETLADFSPSQVCPNPVGIECETTSGTPWYQTGQVYTCLPHVGGMCNNSEQSGGFCQDYRVRFYCP